jgi:EAL domain-containing protein (putative c-di-GMP-specific phosphodiesterase class I)
MSNIHLHKFNGFDLHILRPIEHLQTELFMTNNKGCAGCKDGEGLGFDFVMAFQPIVDMAARKVWGYEALVRGTNGEGAGWVLGQVTSDNRYRFDQACRVKAITGAGELFKEPHLRLSINFMPNAVYEPAACIRTSLAAAEKVGFARERIMFEFTEEERLDVAHIGRIIAEYKRLGFMVALDDFGSGYNGLGMLADFRADLIKIDMQLLRGIDQSTARQAIVAGILGIARALDIQVLAEGVETDKELAVLMAAGITLFQGYLFAKPMIGMLPPVELLGETAQRSIIRQSA